MTVRSALLLAFIAAAIIPGALLVFLDIRLPFVPILFVALIAASGVSIAAMNSFLKPLFALRPTIGEGSRFTITLPEAGEDY